MYKGNNKTSGNARYIAEDQKSAEIIELLAS